MNRKRIREAAMPIALVVVVVATMGINRDWVGTTPPPNNIWSNNAHWSPPGIPAVGDDVRHLSNSIGQAQIFKETGADDSTLSSFEGQVASNQNRSVLLDDGELLQTTGNIFRTGNANGTYMIQVGQSATVNNLSAVLNAGADYYGFITDLRGIDGASASVTVGSTMGYGPVLLAANTFGLTPSASIELAGGGNSGVINCRYAGLGNPLISDPIGQSYWHIGDGNPPAYSMTVTSATINNVGDWKFFPNLFNGTQITTNLFDMYEQGGTFEIHNVQVNVNNTFFNAPAPHMIFDGSSQLLYGLGGDNLLNFFTVGILPGRLTFANAASLMRPTAYEPAEASLEIHVDGSSFLLEANSKVARDALLFDAALADLSTRPTPIEVEACTPDVCNVEFIDHLVPDGTNPVTPFPKYNRCVKYWHNLHLDFAGISFMTLDEGNPISNPPPGYPAFSNQEPDYVPANYPHEAYYFAQIELQSGDTLLHAGDPLRVYARTVPNPQPGFPVTLIGLTRYMDADLDFDVDLVDVARFQNSFTGINKPTWYPLADFGTSELSRTGDCDVDLDDFKELRRRWHSSGTGYMVCTTPPLGNAGLPNGDPTVMVCGGPIHVRPTAVPALNCPNCQMYPFPCGTLPNCGGVCPWDFAIPGGGGDSFTPLGGEGGDESDGALYLPSMPLGTPEEMAAALAEALSPGDLASAAALLLADGLASGDDYAVAVAQLLGG